MGVCNLFLKLTVFIVFQIACAQHQHAHPHPTLQAKLEPSLNTRILPNLKGSVNPQRHPSALHSDVQSRLYNSHSQLDDDEKRINRHDDTSEYRLLQQLSKSQNQGQSSEPISSRSHVSDVYQQPTKLKNLIVMSKVNTKSQNTADDDSDYQDDDDDGRYVDPANRLLHQKLSKPQNQEQSPESISSRSHVSDVYEQPTKLKNLLIISKVNTNSQKTVNDADNSDDDQSNDDDPEDDVNSGNVSPVESRKFSFDSDNAADVYEQPVKLDNVILLSKVNADSLNSVGGSTEPKKSKRRKHHRRPVPEQQEQPEQPEEPDEPEQPEQPEDFEESEDRQPYPDNDDGNGRKVPYDNSVAKRYYGSNEGDNNYQQPAKSTNVDDVYQQPVELDNAVIMSKVNTDSGPGSRNNGRHRNRKHYRQPYPDNDDGYGRRNPYENDDSVAKRYDDNDYQRPAKADGIALISQVNEGSSRGSGDRARYRQREHHRPYPYNYEDSQRRHPYNEEIVNRKLPFGSNVADAFYQPVEVGNISILSKLNVKESHKTSKHSSKKSHRSSHHSASRRVHRKQDISNVGPIEQIVGDIGHVVRDFKMIIQNLATDIRSALYFISSQPRLALDQIIQSIISGLLNLLGYIPHILFRNMKLDPLQISLGLL